MRAAIIADPHYGGLDRLVAVDKPFWRISSTASDRMKQFLNVSKRYNPDAYVFLGDMVDGAAVADPAAQVTQWKADVAACGLTTVANTKFFMVAGNHELTAWGDDDTGPNDYFAEVGAAHHGISLALFWKAGADADQRTAWYVNSYEGFRLIGLATARGTPNSDNFDDGAYACLAENNQLDWLKATSLNAAEPIIIFSHGHLTTAPGIGYAYNDDETGNALARAEFESTPGAGSVIAVICGHYHKGLKYTTGSICDVVNGIPYYGLSGSISGSNPGDINSNTFYIFDFNTTGVERILEFQHVNGKLNMRERYTPGACCRGRYGKQKLSIFNG